MIAKFYDRNVSSDLKLITVRIRWLVRSSECSQLGKRIWGRPVRDLLGLLTVYRAERLPFGPGNVNDSWSITLNRSFDNFLFDFYIINVAHEFLCYWLIWFLIKHGRSIASRRPGKFPTPFPSRCCQGLFSELRGRGRPWTRLVRDVPA